MIDVVYILGTESPWENNELRYSLRSVSTHLGGVKRIFVVGSHPQFVKFDLEVYYNGTFSRKSSQHTPIIFINHDDDMMLTKERRIMEKIKFACTRIPDLTDEFLFMNDDFFLLSSATAGDIPFYQKGTLLNSAKKREKDRYYHALVNCHFALVGKELPAPLNFDTHAPIVYNKYKFLDVINRFNWDITHGYVVKSLYCNTLGLDHVHQADCKIDEPLTESMIMSRIQGRPFFSIGDSGLNDSMKSVLHTLYPDKCIWEK